MAVQASRPGMKGDTWRDGGFNTVLHTRTKCWTSALCEFGSCTKLHHKAESPWSELPDSFLAHYATHNTQEVYLFIGKIFFKEYFLFMWIGGKYCPRCQYVLKANAIFLSCPVFNFTPVCMKAKVYLFCKNEEGLLIEKNYTSVLQFTVHMPPVIHLILSRLYKLSNSFSTYKLIHVE